MSTLLIHYDNLPTEERQRILKAIDRLAKDNPDVATQLEKLADIKEHKPAQWLMGKKILKL